VSEKLRQRITVSWAFIVKHGQYFVTGSELKQARALTSRVQRVATSPDDPVTICYHFKQHNTRYTTAGALLEAREPLQRVSIAGVRQPKAQLHHQQFQLLFDFLLATPGQKSL